MIFFSLFPSVNSADHLRTSVWLLNAGLWLEACFLRDSRMVMKDSYLHMMPLMPVTLSVDPFRPNFIRLSGSSVAPRSWSSSRILICIEVFTFLQMPEWLCTLRCLLLMKSQTDICFGVVVFLEILAEFIGFSPGIKGKNRHWLLKYSHR